jgi:N-acetylmuramoyl-L-alanine amidase
MFIFGSVARPGNRFRVNGSTVPVHPKGGFLAYLPVEPGTFTFRCELDLPEGTTTWARNVQFAQRAAAPSSPETAEILSPAEDVELSPGDWLGVRARAAPGSLATFSLTGVPRPLPMAETRPGLFEGAYQIGPSERFLEAEIYLFVKGSSSSAASLLAPGRLSVCDQPPGVAAVRSEGIVNVRSGPGQGYILFPVQGTRFLVTGRSGRELRVQLSQTISGWIDDRAVEWLPPGTPPPQAVLGDISLAGADPVSTLTLDLTQKVPFQVEVSPDLSAITLRLFSTVGRTNWIVYTGADDFVRSVDWAQRESGVVEVAVRLRPGRTLWGYDALWRSGSLRLEIRKPPRIAAKPNSPLKGRVIILDPGHGASAPGAVGPLGTWESDANFLLSKEVQALLAKGGAHALLTRESRDADASLQERMRRAIARKGEIFVSMHNNALPDGDNPFERRHGYSVFYYHPQSFELASEVYRAYRRCVDSPGEGLRYGNLFVARATQMPSILTESAYLMFPEGEDQILDPARRKALAKAIADGIRDFLEAERSRQKAR